MTAIGSQRTFGLSSRTTTNCVMHEWQGSYAMLGLTMAGFALALVQSSLSTRTDWKQVCAIGYIAMQDLLTAIPPDPGYNAYFSVKPNFSNPTLLNVCPQLQETIPKKSKIATEADEELADSKTELPRFIYTIGVPRIDASGNHATIDMGLRCGYMCAAGYRVHYRRTENVWRMERAPRRTVGP